MALKAAEYLLDQSSGEELSTRKIAAQMGYSVGTLYQLYESLPHLLLQVNARTATLLSRAIEKIPEHEPDPLRKIDHFVQIHIQLSQQYPRRWQLLFSQDNCHGQAFKPVFQFLEQQLARLRPDSPAAEIQKNARILWSAILGVCQFHPNVSRPSERLRDIQILIRHFLGGWQQH